MVRYRQAKWYIRPTFTWLHTHTHTQQFALIELWDTHNRYCKMHLSLEIAHIEIEMKRKLKAATGEKKSETNRKKKQ